MISAVKSLSIALALALTLNNQPEPDPEVIVQSQVDRPVIYQIA